MLETTRPLGDGVEALKLSAPRLEHVTVLALSSARSTEHEAKLTTMQHMPTTATADAIATVLKVLPPESLSTA